MQLRYALIKNECAHLRRQSLKQLVYLVSHLEVLLEHNDLGTEVIGHLLPIQRLNLLLLLFDQVSLLLTILVYTLLFTHLSSAETKGCFLLNPRRSHFRWQSQVRFVYLLDEISIALEVK